jgi:WD40 repeat protein
MRRLCVLLILIALILAGTGTTFAQNDTNHVPVSADNAAQVRLQAILGRGWLNNALAWSPDGAILAVGTSAGVWLHDTGDWQAEPLLLETGIDTWSVAFNPDGSLLATGGRDNSLKVWPVSAILESPDAPIDPLLDVFCRMGRIWWPVDAVVFSPDGRTVACAVDGVKLWEVETGENVATFASEENYDGDRAIAFSPDGSRVFSGGSHRVGGDANVFLRLWDGETYALLDSWRMPLSDEHPTALALSPDGSQIAIGTNKGNLHLWDADTGEKLRRLNQSSATINSVAFSPDGTTLVAVQWFGGVSRWDLTTGEPLPPLYGLGRDDYLGCYEESVDTWSPCPINLEILSAAYHPDGSLLATADSTGQITLWDTGTDQAVTTLTGYALGGAERNGASSDTTSITAIDFSPDGTTLAAGTGGYITSGGWVELWDLETRTLRGYLPGGGGNTFDLDYSPDGTLLSMVTAYSALQLWDPATGDLRFHLDEDAGASATVAFAPDGTVLAGVRWNGTVHLIDTHTGEIRARWEGDSGQGNAAVFSPDGRLLVSGGDDGIVHLLDIETGETLALLLDRDSGYVTGMAASPAPTEGDRTGWLLAVSGSYDDAPIHLWTVTGTGDDIVIEELVTLSDPDDWVRPLAFSRDGTLLASGHEDGIVRLWNPLTGDLLAELPGHGRHVTDLRFNREGTLLASGGFDGTVRLWAVGGD